MPKTAFAAALAALILAAVTPTAQAMPIVPHHTVFAGLCRPPRRPMAALLARPLGAATLPHLLARPLGTGALPLTRRPSAGLGGPLSAFRGRPARGKGREARWASAARSSLALRRSRIFAPAAPDLALTPRLDRESH
jgi:hypothetical protein